MASRFVTELIIAAAKPVGATIRNGKPLLTIIGAIGGGALGTSSGLIMTELIPAGILIGALAGATMAAFLFQRPASIPGARAAETEPFAIGARLQGWTFASGEFGCLTVLLERALYVVLLDNDAWEVLRQLDQGIVPSKAEGDLIRLDEVTGVEMKNPGATVIHIVHSVDGRMKRNIAYFQTTEKRDELVGALERHFGKPFRRTQCPIEFSRAIRTPTILAVVVGVIFGAVAWLAANWRAQPPPWPPGSREQSPLVQLLVWAGPSGVLLAGVVAVLPILAWLARRILNPPSLYVLELVDR